MDGVALHAQRQALEQRRPAAGARLLDRALRLAVDGEDVGAVDDDSLEAVRLGAVGDVLGRELEMRRRRVRPLVVVADEDDRKLARAGERHRLVRVAARRGALAEPADRDARLLADPEGERAADGDGEHRRQVADHRDQPELRVGHVDVAVAAVRRAVLAAHVLREDPPRLDTARDVDAHVAVERRADVVRAHRRRDADRGGLVAAARVERAGDLALPVEDVAALLDAAGDEHVAVDAEQVLAVEARLAHLVERADGSASLAIAIGRKSNDRPSRRLADLSQARARLVVAEGAGDPRLVRGARREAERGGGLVVARQVGVEHRRVVGRDRAADAGGDELRQRMLLERARRRRCGGSRAGRRRARCRGRRAPRRGPGPRRRGSRAGSGRRRAPRARRAPTGPGRLAGVRHRAEPERARERERRRERLRRRLRLEPAEPDADDAALRYGERVAHRPSPPPRRVDATEDVGRQPHLDAVQFACLLSAVAVAAEDRVGVDACATSAAGDEDRLDVDGAVRPPPPPHSRHDDLAEVVRQCTSECDARIEDLDEMREVAVVELRLEVVGQRVVVPLRDPRGACPAAPSPRGGRATRSSGDGALKCEEV